MKVVNRFEKAVREHERLGSKWEDHRAINKEYKEAKRELINFIKELTRSKRINS